MAVTAFGTNDAQAVKLWSTVTMREALKRRKSVGSTALRGSGTDSKPTVSEFRARKTKPA